MGSLCSFSSIFTDKKKKNLETTKFKVVDRLRITKPKFTFSKVCTQSCRREISFIDSALETTPWI